MLKLESIESSIFEELSNSIIYFQYGINIISTGLNREGKPIKCPIDAIGIIKNDDKTEFVFIEATTTQVNSLKDKWLSKSDDKPGDIIKTYKKAKEFFNLNKNSSFKLFLMTNRDLSGDKGLDLITEVENENFDIPLKIEIMEQGSIKQFLDHDSDGQYLRKKFLQRVRPIIKFFDWILIKGLCFDYRISGISGVILHLKFHFITFFR